MPPLPYGRSRTRAYRRCCFASSFFTWLQRAQVNGVLTRLFATAKHCHDNFCRGRPITPNVHAHKDNQKRDVVSWSLKSPTTCFLPAACKDHQTLRSRVTSGGDARSNSNPYKLKLYSNCM